MSKTIDKLQTLMAVREVSENRFLRLMMEYVDETKQLDAVVEFIKERTDAEKRRRKEKPKENGRGRLHI